MASKLFLIQILLLGAAFGQQQLPTFQQLPQQQQQQSVPQSRGPTFNQHRTPIQQPPTDDVFQQTFQHINSRGQKTEIVHREQAVPLQAIPFQQQQRPGSSPFAVKTPQSDRISSDYQAALDFQKSVAEAVRQHVKSQANARPELNAPTFASSPVPVSPIQTPAPAPIPSRTHRFQIPQQTPQQVPTATPTFRQQQTDSGAIFVRTQPFDSSTTFQQDESRGRPQQQQEDFLQHQQPAIPVQQTRQPVSRQRTPGRVHVAAPTPVLRTQEPSTNFDTTSDETDAELIRQQAQSAKYTFASALNDRLNDNAQVRQETRDGLHLAGLYSYSDGFFKRTVHYEADENGYRVTKEEVEPIGDGPQPDPEGTADVSAQISGANFGYSITAKDIKDNRQQFSDATIDVRSL